MKAIACRRYGAPEVLEVVEVEKPAVPDDGVLVRVHASSVNPVDFFSLSGVRYVSIAMPVIDRLASKKRTSERAPARVVTVIG